MPPTASLNQVTVSYGKKTALNNVTFEIGAGQVVGLIGANGAGKSTAIRTLLGQTRCNAGSATFLGEDPTKMKPSGRQGLGYLPGDLRLPAALTGQEFLDSAKSFYRSWNHERVNKLAAGLRLPLNQRIFGYSTGMERQLAFIQAVAHDPKLLILDEPERGLDPVARSWIYKTIEELSASGSAILIASHNLSECQRCVSHLVILKAGEIAAAGTIDDVRKSRGHDDLFDIFQSVFHDRLP